MSAAPRVECPSCTGTGEKVTPNNDPQLVVSEVCSWCHGDGTISQEDAVEYRQHEEDYMI